MDMVMEGGAIDSNGAGSLLTTEACLVRSRHGSGRRRHAAIERALHAYFGVDQVFWLGSGIAGDDTGGHVDDIARFVGKTTIFCVVEQNRHDANYQALQTN